MTVDMKQAFFASALLPVLFQFNFFSRDYFIPAHQLTGIGVERERMSEAVLARRTELMIESQTFSILRDPRALAGAQRITSPKLKKIFTAASQRSGVPASLISSIAYLESWGIANAESPAGPKGIMQVASGTARSMGLRMIYATRHRTVVERRQVKGKRGKLTVRTVRRRVPYTVLVRDERLVPERAVPAAANYLARLESRYASRDWAVFAYHCGEGCAAEFMDLVRRSQGFKDQGASVAQVFFGAHPAHNRELHDAVQHHMERDFSPTYWFRIRRAEQLLKLYEDDPSAFRKLFSEYRNQTTPDQRAPHRLSVWLKPEDLSFRTCDDLKREQGRKLVRAFDHAKYFGFSLRTTGLGSIGEDDPANRDFYLQAAPSTMGTIAYIAYETRRLHEAMKPRGEKYVPLEITALVQPLDYEQRIGRRSPSGKAELPSHCSGQVFDLNYGSLPAGEREALEFVLNDLGWDGYLGFVKDSASESTFHIGAAPSAREFFSQVYYDAMEKKASD